MSKLQYHGIKFPITVESDERHLFDLNDTMGDSITSQLIHLIFTPKGQMLRNPDFGTSLIQYIFSPNDAQTWGDIVTDIKESVSKFIPKCNINDVETRLTDNGLGLDVILNYSVKEENGKIFKYTTTTKLF